MITVNVLQAKTTLSRLLAQVEAGEDVLIARNGKPVARLTRAGRAERNPGLLSGEPGWQGYDPSVWAPASDEDLAGDGWPV